jgi:cysteine synthase B
MKHEISRLPDRYRPFLEKYPSLALIGGTPLLRVRVPELPENGAEIFAKAEWTNLGGSVKDRPVLRMLLEAVLSGELTRERTILDSSSGNAGIAYAMIGSMMGYQVELVVPGNASEERKKRIRAHGATLVETDPLEGYDAALREAHRRAEAQPDRYYMPDQYANDNNWRAHYETTALEILEQTGGTDHAFRGRGRNRGYHHRSRAQTQGARPEDPGGLRDAGVFSGDRGAQAS